MKVFKDTDTVSDSFGSYCQTRVKMIPSRITRSSQRFSTWLLEPNLTPKLAAPFSHFHTADANRCLHGRVLRHFAAAARLTAEVGTHTVRQATLPQVVHASWNWGNEQCFARRLARKRQNCQMAISPEVPGYGYRGCTDWQQRAARRVV